MSADGIKRATRRNFFIVDNAIFSEKSTLGPLEKLVYICLLRYADNNTRQAFPGQQRIASDCGISRKRVNQAVAALIEAGYLDKQHQYDKKGGQKSNLYIVYDANEVIHKNEYEEHPPVTQGNTPCNPELHPPVTQGNTKKTHLKILKEEEEPYPQADNKDLVKVDFSKLKSLIKEVGGK